MKTKQSLLIGAAIAAATVGGASSASLVSAATDSSSSTNTSIVDKLATKFKLNKTDVQAVFDEDRQAKQADRDADQKEVLAAAVNDGKLTQAQSDHIAQAQSEIKSLLGTGDPRSQSEDIRTQIKAKIDDLRKWATDNKVDSQYIMIGHGGGHGGPGRGMAMRDAM